MNRLYVAYWILRWHWRRRKKPAPQRDPWAEAAESTRIRLQAPWGR